MAARSKRCNGCGLQLAVPPEATVIQCVVCRTATPIRSPDPLVQVCGHVRKAATWFKDLMSNVSGNLNSYLTRTNYTTMTSAPQQVHHPMFPPLYPAMNGNKRALLCGISYRGSRHELMGTVNDVNCMRYLLRNKLGFSDDCILVLTEDERDQYRIPTKQNILMGLHWLVHGCQPGDSLVFHYSGHGSQQPDDNGDEIDGQDETLWPLDFETQGLIKDDEINATIVSPLPHGVKLHAIIDACHSGTVLDLPFVCRMDRNGFYSWDDHTCPWVHKGTKGGLAVSFSSCADNQTSADTSALSGKTTTGAMTYSFIQAVESEPTTTYGRMLTAMRSAIREAKTGIPISGPIASLARRVFGLRLTQEPQLSSSEPFDIYSKQLIL